MGNRERARDYFRKQVRGERERRGWSQSHLAKLLSDKGIGAHTTTIAKIEAGDRAVPVDEAAAIADLFEVSLDKLLGRDLGPKRDKMYAFRALLDTAQQAAWQALSIEAALRDSVAELDAFDLPQMMKAFRSDCERACDALAAASDALHAGEPSGGGELSRLSRKMLLDELQKEVASDETQP